MSNIKLEKGITLIALIITIVVLLILASVAIGAIQDSKIIGHAKNATASYVVEQEKERIALAYSEYKIEKILDPTKTLEITGEDATTEPVGEYGWKVTYEETENVYGVNTKGEYDEAVTMVIKAVDEVSEIFNEFKTTNPDLDIDGISLDDFIIYEDKKAISENAANINTEEYTIVPEKYVFYNWNKLTTDEIRVIETQYTPEEGSEKVKNATNRLFMLDINGDGYPGEIDYNMIQAANTRAINSDGYKERVGEYPMEQSKNNHIANLCIIEEIDETTGEKITLYDKMVKTRENASEYYRNFNENVDLYSHRCNFLMKFYGYGTLINAIRTVLSGDTSRYAFFWEQSKVFYELYTNHVYYTSERPKTI